MPHVQVRDVPEEVHDVLVRRARLSGQSLQQYLAGELARLASTPTMNEVLDRIGSHATGRLSGRDAVSALEAERDRR
jgi:antitoxin FitA